MRAILMVGLFLTGVIAMTTVADAQEKKEEKEAITVKRWIAAQKMFLNPTETKGVLEERKGKTYWKVHNGEKGFDAAETGSEISRPDGSVWVVEAVVPSSDEFTHIRVKQKAVAKKD